MSSSINARAFCKYRGGKWEVYTVCPPAEILLTIVVNSKELISIVCSPDNMEQLTIGFLYNEGVITSIDEIKSLEVDTVNCVACVMLTKEQFPKPHKLILTPGFGGGIIFSQEKMRKDIEMFLNIHPERLCFLMEEMKNNAVHYKRSGGIHASAVCDDQGIVIQAEDVGRHNTMDKVMGEALMKKISLQGKLMLTTGRISSEMILKASNMGIPIMASLSSPTTKAVDLARKTGIGLAGYVQKDQFIAYANADHFKDGD
ncbi:formate dehydrogenase accessory sulfurtransferase FdhD [Dehalobacter sp. DCM]|uniref:formate dehydrogenase accessory sulfurtransferase FdhD n=1 Tax=Dehalobacter sp. DCM TaxID=2907827 RepID=UPI0030817994|nr:formate dehydrogenase accessory sulfurtransferase FdhD [Dehalobacter sp. DCM]